MRPNTELIKPLSERGFQPIASIKPKHARDIESSPWSIGCETTDRDYVDFSQVGPHLGELGAKHVRIQAGWAKCDAGPGQPLNWETLDAIVDGSLAQGVQPWLEASYGNPAYPGGGGIGLSQGIPTSEEALAAWDRWISAMVDRYADRVSTWEIWNEGNNWRRDLNDYAVPPELFADFHVRTARLIRERQPKATIVALALGFHDGKYAPRFFDKLKALEALDLVDEVSIHGYPSDPDNSFAAFADLDRLVKRYDPRISIRQGETGANSVSGSGLAMGEMPWSERKQAVWDLRRLLVHHAHGIPMSLFQLADMYYEKLHGALYDVCNTKGLLRILPDKSVAYRKPAYFAAQHVFTLFDGRLACVPRDPFPVRTGSNIAAWCWDDADGTPAILAWWRAHSEPDLWLRSCESLGLEAIPIDDPVLVDFLSGRVFELPDTMRNGEHTALQDLPAFDSPIAVVRRDWMETTPLTNA